MYCPNCRFKFKAMFATGPVPDEPTPVLCEQCTKICILVEGSIRRCTDEELKEIEQSPAFVEVLGPLQRVMRMRNKAGEN